MDAAEAGAAGRAGSSADSLAEEEEDEDEAGPGSGRSSRTSSLVSGLLTELYSAAEAAAPSGSARSRALRELQQRPSQVKYLRLKGTARPACLPPPGPGAAPAASLFFCASKGVLPQCALRACTHVSMCVYVSISTLSAWPWLPEASHVLLPESSFRLLFSPLLFHVS